jgi:hypothetical protein
MMAIANYGQVCQRPATPSSGAGLQAWRDRYGPPTRSHLGPIIGAAMQWIKALRCT